VLPVHVKAEEVHVELPGLRLIEDSQNGVRGPKFIQGFYQQELEGI
jgi:hypothetical protein